MKKRQSRLPDRFGSLWPGLVVRLALPGRRGPAPLRLTRGWLHKPGSIELTGSVGQDSIEYALLMTLVAVASLIALGATGVTLDQTWQHLSERLEALVTLF